MLSGGEEWGFKIELLMGGKYMKVKINYSAMLEIPEAEEYVERKVRLLKRKY